MYYAEKKAKEFLQKEGFDVLDSIYIKKESKIKQKLKKLKFPLAEKIFGSKIVHKKRLGGVKLNLKDEKEAVKSFRKFKKIKNVEGVVFQEQIKGKEILLGIKKTPEFSHVIVFGQGGSQVEKIKDVSFRVTPFDKKEAMNMIKETKVHEKLSTEEINSIIKNILKLNNLIKKHPQISELDINPLMVKKNKARVVDARIVFKKN